jgi:hypothetical protein
VVEEDRRPKTQLTGTAVFLLPDPNPEWFQGYFFPKQTEKSVVAEGGAYQKRASWGLLCEQEELDECVQCANGGYRQITISLNQFGSGKDPIKLQNVEWTGGDMMRLDRTPDLQMEATRLSTGTSAVRYVEGLFGGLLNKVREDGNESVLEVMPDVAIVMGNMNLTIAQAAGEMNHQ